MASQLTQPVKTVLLAYQACCPEFEPQNPGEVGKQPPDKAKEDSWGLLASQSS